MYSKTLEESARYHHSDAVIHLSPSSYLSISKLSEPNSQCTRIIQSSITGDKWVDLESIDHGHPLRDAFESSNGENIYIDCAPPAAGKAKSLGDTAGKMTAETQQANKPYEAKNVLITGGAGFIASHVAILFAKKYPQYKVRPRAPWKRAAPASVRAREASRAPPDG